MKNRKISGAVLLAFCLALAGEDFFRLAAGGCGVKGGVCVFSGIVLYLGIGERKKSRMRG